MGSLNSIKENAKKGIGSLNIQKLNGYDKDETIFAGKLDALDTKSKKEKLKAKGGEKGKDPSKQSDADKLSGYFQTMESK